MFHTWSQTLRNQHLSGYRFESEINGPNLDNGPVATGGSIADSAVDSQPQQRRDTQLCWLHGNGFNSLAYTPLFETLLKSGNPEADCQDSAPVSIFCTDLPGHGRSSPAPENWPDWLAMAAAVEQAMQRQLPPSLHDDATACRRIGVGHSLGAVVTLLQAYQNPDRFEKILLLDPILFSPAMILGQQAIKTLGLWPRAPLVKQALGRRNRWQSPAAMQQQLAGKGLYRRWHPQALGGFVEGGHRRLNSDTDLSELELRPGQNQAQVGAQKQATSVHQSGPHAVELSCSPQWEAQIFASYPRLLGRALKQIRIPVEIICAERSMPFIVKNARRAAALNSNISYRIWGQGHCFPMEQPRLTAELIRQWALAVD